MNTEELKRLAEAASAGPWEHEQIDPSDPEWGACEVFSKGADEFVSTHVSKVCDAAYIAAANPAAILSLIAERDALLAALKDVMYTGFTGGPQGKRALAAIAKAEAS